MKNISFLLVVIWAGGLSQASAGADCYPKERHAMNQSFDLKGWLAYSPNGMDARLRNLSSGEDRLIYDAYKVSPQLIPVGLVGNNFTLVNHDNVIVASSGYGSTGLYLIQKGKILVLVEDKSGSIKFKNPVFFAAYEKLLYVHQEINVAGDRMAYLYETTIKSGQIKKEPFVTTSKSQIDEGYNFLTKISDDELLFKHHNTGYVLYNLRTNQLLNVSIRLEEGCVPVAWREKTKELVCGQRGGWDLLDMDGNKRRIPGEVPRVINAYVPDDYLIGYNKYLTDGGCRGIQGVIYDFESEKSWPFPVITLGRARWYDAR